MPPVRHSNLSPLLHIPNALEKAAGRVFHCLLLQCSCKVKNNYHSTRPIKKLLAALSATPGYGRNSISFPFSDIWGQGNSSNLHVNSNSQALKLPARVIGGYFSSFSFLIHLQSSCPGPGHTEKMGLSTAAATPSPAHPRAFLCLAWRTGCCEPAAHVSEPPPSIIHLY